MSDTRQRGYILTEGGWLKLRTALHRWEVTSGKRAAPRQLAVVVQLAGLPGPHHNTIRRILERRVSVDVASLRLMFRAFALDLEATDYVRSPLPRWSARQPSDEANPCDSFGRFFGRVRELDTLEHWLTLERCRLIALHGPAGIGKSALVARLLPRLGAHFERIVWRSLASMPHPADLLADLLVELSSARSRSLPTSESECLARLLERLESGRHLLVLDDFEAVLRPEGAAGLYGDGLEAYGALLRRLGEQPGHSAVLVVSRVKPGELATLAGRTLPVRALRLGGLGTGAGRELFASRGTFEGCDEGWQTLIAHYGGNPLALQIAAASIEEIFDGRIAPLVPLLGRGSTLFSEIERWLSAQLDRLPVAEKLVLRELALAPEPIGLAHLQHLTAGSVAGECLVALQSLRRRSLVEGTAEGLWVQPVIGEYIRVRWRNLPLREVVAAHPEEPSGSPLKLLPGRDLPSQPQQRRVEPQGSAV